MKWYTFQPEPWYTFRLTNTGNSIVVPVLESILKEIIKGEENEGTKQD